MASPSSSNSSVSTSDSSFKQLSYCQLCKLSHDTAKSHVYSKRHQTSLQSLLQKFAVKVKEIKSSVKTPCIKDEYYEMGAKTWCHFCECEVEKHLHEDGVVICYGEALHHFQSVQHLKNAKHFWWKNKLDPSKLDTYVITSSEHSVFRENVSKAKAEYLQQKADMHQQHVAHIISVEALRKEIVQNAVHEESESCSFKSRDETRVKNEPVSQSTSGGNIFTGMLPPWLQQDDKIADKKEIGPSLADYEKNLEILRKSKLPSNRVGANFDRDATRSADWLPSFGRVWNNGRRLASKQEFEKRRAKRRHIQPRASQRTNTPRGSSTSSGAPPNMSKYVL